MLKSNIEINKNEIIISNASIHNIKNLSVKIPLNKLVSIVGKSGSGKSSLIYDFLFKNYERGIINNKFNSNIYALKQKNYLSKNQILSSGEFIFRKFNELKKELQKGDILILDEPCVGMGKEDTLLFLKEVKELIRKNISVILIEHNKYVIQNSDYIIEFGPGAGVYGGQIIFSDELTIFKNSNSITSKLIFKNDLFNEKKLNLQTNLIKIKDINFRNLNNFKVEFPLYSLSVIRGNVGKGKSSLLEYTYKYVYKGKDAWKIREDINYKDENIFGKQNIRRSYIISQNPISNNPNSIVATYINILNEIRNIFVDLDGSNKLNLTKQDFNIDKDFNLENINSNILDVKFNGLNIYEVLSLTIDEVYVLFEDNSIIRRKLEFLKELDLGYIVIGQKSFTLSGGEAQRIKLAKILTKKLGDRCLYLLDTPTKGLHILDISKLSNIFNKIISKKNTILIVENNIELINKADYLIEL